LVVLIADSGSEAFPFLRRLAWLGAHQPSPGELATLRSAGRLPLTHPGMPTVQLVRHSRRDPDWTAVGFEPLVTGLVDEPDTRVLRGPAWMTTWADLDRAIGERLAVWVGPCPQPADHVGYYISTWDPLGIGSSALIESEYDALVPPLVTRLAEGAGPMEIAEFLRTEMLDYFGLPLSGAETDPVAAALVDAAHTWTPSPPTDREWAR
jgi:hypothetical protein